MGLNQGKQIWGKKLVATIGILFFLTASDGLGKTKEKAPTPPPTPLPVAPSKPTHRALNNEVAKVYLSEKEDLIFIGLHSYHSTWFRIPDSVRQPVEGEFEFAFSFSTVLIPESSNITVFINDVPIKSITLANRDPEKSEELFKVPPGLFKAGLNHLRLQLYAQANVDECKDIDNPANWYVVLKQTNLRLFYDPHPPLELKYFPEPLLAMGRFSQKSLTFIMPEKPTTTLIEAYTNTAKQLGALNQETTGTIAIHSRGEKQPTKKEFLESNLVVLGKRSELPLGLASQTVLGKDLVEYAFDRSPWSDKSLVFSISSEDEKHLKPAVNHLVSHILKRNFKGKEKTVDPYYHPYSRIERQDIFASRRSFEQLGYGDDLLRGTFYNEKEYYFSIPSSWKLKKNAGISFMMDMSPLLVGDQSEMSVLINGIYAGSTKLKGDRQNSLAFHAEIPNELLLEEGFIIRARFYLDIGQKGCERRYPEKAWILIHKESYVSLPHTDKTSFALKDLPAPYMVKDKIELPLIVIPDNPSYDDLSTLYRFAFALGVFLPLNQDWLPVKQASEVTEQDWQNHLVVLGTAEANSFFSQVNPSLPISFSRENSSPFIYQASLKKEEKGGTEYRWDLPADFRGETGCIELLKSPWNEEKSVLVVTGTDPYLLLDAVDVIKDQVRLVSIDTTVAIVNAEGGVIPYRTKIGTEETQTRQSEFRAKLPAFIIIVITAIFAIVVSLYFMQKNKRK